MLGAIYTGLSGMNSYSRGLDVISNNVANLNTPGFKVAVPRFSDMVFRLTGGAVTGSAGTPARGAGVNVDPSQLSFRQGELRDTGNSLDVAVDGNGFFIVEQDGRRLYTRAGQFEFDSDGFLVERGTGAKVQFSTELQAIGAFNVDGMRVFAPKATTEVVVTGTLARGGDQTTFELPSISAIDSAGGRHTLKARFVRDSSDPLRWAVEIVDEDNTVLGSGEIRFGLDGTPHAESPPLTFTVTPEDAPAFTATVKFGAPGTFSGVSSAAGSTQSNLQVLRQDGVQVGALTTLAFDEKGALKLTYSNGETKTVGNLLLARFDAPDELTALGGALFSSDSAQQPRLGTGLESGFGRLVGGRVELSNVELTEQFTDLIIIQRGYQASSQMASVANELIQQLLAMDGRK